MSSTHVSILINSHPDSEPGVEILNELDGGGARLGMQRQVDL